MKAPFTSAFVVSETLRHMKRCVDTSIAKTTARLGETRDNPEMGSEILGALISLNRLGRVIDSIRSNELNIELFAEEETGEQPE